MVASIRDMERKLRLKEVEIEAGLQQMEKLEAVATLAGGIAHQFNNALMAIVGNIDLLQLDLPDHPVVGRYAGSMRAAVQRMTCLTDQLLAYARGGKYQPRILSLNEVVEKSIPEIRRGANPAIHIEHRLSDMLPEVTADPAQMRMVLSALVENAKEAIEGTGRIRIITSEEAPPGGLTRGAGPRNGRFACLRVEDTGKGMDEPTKSRLFEPFFTTKLMGRGLSMAAVYGIVKNHEGWIGVDSSPGSGTTVHIFLPMASVAMTREAKETGYGLGAGRPTVLVVEDEAPVMAVCREILERMGYRVLSAENGCQAVNLAEAVKEPIDLVLLDVQLPDMPAPEVYSLLIRARPGLRVLVCSGYDADVPVQEMLRKGALGFLHKPFGFESLARKLREILGTVKVQAV